VTKWSDGSTLNGKDMTGRVTYEVRKGRETIDPPDAWEKRCWEWASLEDAKAAAQAANERDGMGDVPVKIHGKDF
jgi:hypothetical protein